MKYKITEILKSKNLVEKIFPHSVYDYHSINPLNNKIIRSYETISPQKTKEIVKKSHDSFNLWKNVSYDNRISKFKNLAINFGLNSERIANSMAIEMGKPINQGKGEVKKCIDHINYYIDNIKELSKNKYINFEPFENEVHFKPIGSILSINPFNFPFWVPLKSIIPSMILGNTIILKPAPSVPGTSLIMEEMFRISGFDNNEFQIVMCSNACVDLNLISDKRIREIIFTGSSKIGSLVGSLAGKNLKKSLLELGGNDAFIVLPDANLDKAALFCAEGRLRNTGQACICSKRIFIHSSIFDVFMEKLIKEIEKYKIGNPTDPSTSLGPIARFDLFLQLKKQVINSLEKGASIIYGEKNDIDYDYDINSGNFIKPMILTNINKECPSYFEELFGPVFSVFKFNDLNEALEIVNDSDYGLGASIFTENINYGKEIADKIDTGMVFINSSTISDSRLPYGGTKSSGYGRTSAYAAINEFSDNKVIGVRKL